MTTNGHDAETYCVTKPHFPSAYDVDGLYSDHTTRDIVSDLIVFRMLDTPNYTMNWEAYDKLDEHLMEDVWTVLARSIDPYVVMMTFYGDEDARKLMEAQVALMLYSTRLRHYWKQELRDGSELSELQE